MAFGDNSVYVPPSAGRVHSSYSTAEVAPIAPGTLSALQDQINNLRSRVADIRDHSANIREKLSGSWPEPLPGGTSAIKTSQGKIATLSDALDEAFALSNSAVEHLEAISRSIS